MGRSATPASLGIALALGVAIPAAAEVNADAAAVRYQLHCSGCHKSDGSGQPGFVPALRGRMGAYLGTPDGRAFLVRVPGVSQSLLSDRDLADVLNFIVDAFDRDGAPAPFQPFEASEVGRLRKATLSDTETERRRVLAAARAPQR